MTKDELLKMRNKELDPPKCFEECDLYGCSMKIKHCGNNDFPPKHRCTKCEWWFTNCEKIE